MCSSQGSQSANWTSNRQNLEIFLIKSGIVSVETERIIKNTSLKRYDKAKEINR